jgi:hypothetical protein
MGSLAGSRTSACVKLLHSRFSRQHVRAVVLKAPFFSLRMFLLQWYALQEHVNPA